VSHRKGLPHVIYCRVWRSTSWLWELHWQFLAPPSYSSKIMNRNSYNNKLKYNNLYVIIKNEYLRKSNQFQFITCPVRLSHILYWLYRWRHRLGPMALASKVQALALRIGLGTYGLGLEGPGLGLEDWPRDLWPWPRRSRPWPWGLRPYVFVLGYITSNKHRQSKQHPANCLCDEASSKQSSFSRHQC